MTSARNKQSKALALTLQRVGQGCYDCGSTIKGHHTRLCDMAEPGDKRDLPQQRGSQFWTGEPPARKLYVVMARDAGGFCIVRRSRSYAKKAGTPLTMAPVSCHTTRSAAIKAAQRYRKQHAAGRMYG